MATRGRQAGQPDVEWVTRSREETSPDGAVTTVYDTYRQRPEPNQQTPPAVHVHTAPSPRAVNVRFMRQPPNTPEYRVERNLWRYLEGYTQFVNVALDDTLQNATDRMIPRLESIVTQQFESCLKSRIQTEAEYTARNITNALQHHTQQAQKNSEAAQKTWQEQKDSFSKETAKLSESFSKEMNAQRKEFNDIVENMHKKQDDFLNRTNDHLLATLKSEQDKLQTIVHDQLGNLMTSQKNAFLENKENVQVINKSWHSSVHDFMRSQQKELKEAVEASLKSSQELLQNKMQAEQREFLSLHQKEFREMVQNHNDLHFKDLSKQLRYVEQRVDESGEKIRKEWENIQKHTENSVQLMVGRSQDSSLQAQRSVQDEVEKISLRMDALAREMKAINSSDSAVNGLFKHLETTVNRVEGDCAEFKELLDNSKNELRDAMQKCHRIKDSVLHWQGDMDVRLNAISVSTEEFKRMLSDSKGRLVEMNEIRNKSHDAMDNEYQKAIQEFQRADWQKYTVTLKGVEDESRVLFENIRGYSQRWKSESEEMSSTLTTYGTSIRAQLHPKVKEIESSVQNLQRDINGEVHSGIQDLAKLLKQRIENSANELDIKYKEAQKTFTDGAASLPEITRLVADVKGQVEKSLPQINGALDSIEKANKFQKQAFLAIFTTLSLIAGLIVFLTPG